MKWDLWKSKSRRISLHPWLQGKSFEARFRALPKLTGSYISSDWTESDSNNVRRFIKQALKEKLTSKGVSEVVFRLLYAHAFETYKKVCFFSRSPKLIGIRHLLSYKFCKICSACFVPPKSKVQMCWLCAKDNKKLARELKSQVISTSNKKAWGTGELVAKRKRNLQAAYGVDNVFQLDSVKAQRIESLVERLGDDWQVQLNAKRMKTNLERIGYTTPLGSPAHRRKATKTIRKRLGVDHQMQHLPTFQKAMAKGRYIYTGRCTQTGRQFKVQGTSEVALCKYLVRKYGSYSVHSQFHKEYPDFAYTELKTFPDFYLDTLNVFVECKSVWTFMGRPGSHSHLKRMEGDIDRNKQKARVANESGNKIYWVIHHKNRKTKQDHFLTLPHNWYNFSSDRLRAIVDNFVKEH